VTRLKLERGLEAHKGTVRLSVEAAPPRFLMRVDGELDWACSDLLNTVAFREAAAIDTVTIDLTGLSFTDTAGVDALLALRAHHLAAGRDVEMVNPQPNVRRLFTLCARGDVLGPDLWQSDSSTTGNAARQVGSVFTRRCHRSRLRRGWRLSGRGGR